MGIEVHIWGDSWLLDDLNPYIETLIVAEREEKSVSNPMEGTE